MSNSQGKGPELEIRNVIWNYKKNENIVIGIIKIKISIGNLKKIVTGIEN